MQTWLTYLSANPQGQRVFVQSADIVMVEEKSGSSQITLHSGAQVDVTAAAITVMAAITPPPQPPKFVVRTGAPGDQQVHVTGTSEPWSIIIVRDGGVLVSSVKADVNGDWEAVAELSVGSHVLTAVQTNAFGLVSEASAPASVVVHAAPPLPAPTITGTLSSPTDATPTLSGQAKPGTTISVLDGDTQIAVTATDGTGRWAFAVTDPLAVGKHAFVATQADLVSGLVSEPSAPYIIDIAAPPAPGAPTAPAGAEEVVRSPLPTEPVAHATETAAQASETSA